MVMGLAGVSFAWSFAANALSFIAFSVILWRVHMHTQAEPERRSRSGTVSGLPAETAAS